MIKVANPEIKKLCTLAGFKPGSEVVKLAKGWWSSAYSFTSGSNKYVIRINSDDADFKKDKLVSQLLQGSGLPVPNIMALGEYRSFHYAISEWCEGHTMIDENTNENDVFRLYECLWQLHQFNMSHLPGWKLLDDDEDGEPGGWQAGLLDFQNHKMDYTIEGLVSTGKLSSEVVKKTMNKIESLLSFCGTAKHLLHGDFGFDNALTDGKQITGLIDWAEARLGDFLYDVAFLIFNSKMINYRKLWLQFLKQKEITIENMNERLLCYQLVIGLNSIAIAAHTNNEKTYQEDLKKLLNLL